MQIPDARDSLDNKLRERLKSREEKGLLRKLASFPELTDFSSNDYLGLAGSAELRRRAQEKLRESDLKFSAERGCGEAQPQHCDPNAAAAAGLRHSRAPLNRYDFAGRCNGSSGSRLLTGNSAFAEALERKIAAFHRTEAALLFNSGYDANLGTLSALFSNGDTVYYDELCHASMHDGIRLSKANAHAFKHNDTAALGEQLGQLREATNTQRWIVVESLYSMSGDPAPLRDLVVLAGRFRAHLFVDEAHATGVFGPNGAGLVQELGLEQDVAVRVHTFGKALGGHGAAVVGSRALRDYLINFARPFIYSTSLPPHSLAAIEAAYDMLPGLDHTRKQLRERIQFFRALAEERQLTSLLPSESAIQALIVNADSVRLLAQKVQRSGFDVRPIVSPTVPLGQERIRICLHSYNTEQEMRGLISALKGGLERGQEIRGQEHTERASALLC
jgi:8-amino-7-oxononanoate synthase